MRYVTILLAGYYKLFFNLTSVFSWPRHSIYFYVFWLVSLFFFSVLIFKFLENKLKNGRFKAINYQIEKADQLKQQTLLKNQLQLQQEKENLSLRIKEKTIELAIKAKEDEDKLRLLHTIREKINEAEENPAIYKIRLKEMRRLLDSYLEIDNKTFEIQMDEIHQEFFKKMKTKFPHLSIYDLRLCAYLKLGLSSKEMADILHVLPSSINVSRSRLRKKLYLNPDDDLFEFLNKIS